jgi:hypothetical protein
MINKLGDAQDAIRTDPSKTWYTIQTDPSKR